MTMQQNELLSALVDDELTGKALQQTLTRLSTDKQASAQFQRYQQISDLLQGYGASGFNTNLVDAVSAKLANEPEPAPSVTAIHKKSTIIAISQSVWKQLPALAVAASVGGLAVIGLMPSLSDKGATDISLAAVDKAQVATVAQSGARWTVAEPEVAHRLNNYLLEHNEYKGSSEVFSYARIISYGAE